MAALNEKQRVFCRLIAVERLNQSEAYSQAFGCKTNSAATLAGRLLKKVEVQEEIQRLSTKVNRAAESVGIWTKLERMERLQEWAELSAEAGKVTDAVNCVRELNRMDGAYEPEKVEVRAQGTFGALLRELDQTDEV